MLHSPNRLISSAAGMPIDMVSPEHLSCSETSPLPPKSNSGVSTCHLAQSATRNKSTISFAMTPVPNSPMCVAVSPLSVTDSSQDGGSTFGYGSSSHGNDSASDRSDASGGAGCVNGGLSFGSPPTSLREFLGTFTQAVRLQSWRTWLLAAVFHLFHLLLIFSFWTSATLYRSTVFSEAMAKSLLEAPSVRQHRGGIEECSSTSRTRLSAAKEKGASGAEKAALLRFGNSEEPVFVVSLWSIHDTSFFLEEGHTVTPTIIESRFVTGRRKRYCGGTTKRVLCRGSDARNCSGANYGSRKGATNTLRQSKSESGPHACTVPYAPGDGGDARKSFVSPTALVMRREDADAAAVNQRNPLCPTAPCHACGNDEGRRSAAVTSDGTETPRLFAGSPPVAPEHKSTRHGQVALWQMMAAWAASPVYTSPLALALFYYFYGIGCVIVLLTVTDGRLTGHFSVLRLCIALLEVLWYLHHGAHAFAIYCWLLVLSHWPHRAMCSPDDAAFLQKGTPYAVVSKKTGHVSMLWFYRAALAVNGGAEDGGGHGGTDKLLVDEINLQCYLYDQVWYLKPLAEGIEVFHGCLLLLCLMKDLHRVLEAIIGVRELMEPEGCARCPLCGERVVMCEQRSFLRANSRYKSSRGRTPWPGWGMMWWRWLRSAVRGRSSGHRVPRIRLRNPLWRWFLPACLGGGPLTKPLVVSMTAGTPASGDDASLTASMCEETTYALAEILEDVEFYEQSATRRSAAAPQDATAEATAHLMRWLTSVPRAVRPRTVRVRDGEHILSKACSGGISAEQDEHIKAMAGVPALEPSASLASERCMSAVLEEEVPAAIPATPSVGGAAALAHSGPASFARTGLLHSSSTHLIASSVPASPRRRQGSIHEGSRRCSQGLLQGLLNSSQQPRTSLQRPQRRTRFKEEVLYWNYATRHVHHRCPRLYLNAQEAIDDEDADREGGSVLDECSSEASSAVSPTAVAQTSGSLTRSATTVSSGAHARSTLVAAGCASFQQGVLRRSLSPRPGRGSVYAGTDRLHTPQLSAAPDKPLPLQEKASQQQPQQRTSGHQHTSAAGDSTHQRKYRIIGPDFPEAPSTLFAQGPPPQSAAAHIVQRGLYDPNKVGEDEFRPGNAFRSYDRASCMSRVTHSWLNPLLTFGLLEPTLLRQECFLPSLPEELLSLDNIAMPAWRLWVHRKLWFADRVTKPGELLIPSNEAMDGAEGGLLSLAHLHEEDPNETGEETESSDGRRTAVMLGHTSLKQVAKLLPKRPRRGWQESLLWALSAPVRWAFVALFYHVCIGHSRTVRRARRRLFRELRKNRTSTAAENLYYTNGHQTMESSEAMEGGTCVPTEMESSSCSSASAPSASSALPIHMRQQLALSDVSLYYLFLEHRCGRRFLLVAAPLLLLSELLTVVVVPAFVLLAAYLQHVDSDIAPHSREAPSDQRNVTEALLCTALLGALLLLQGVVHSSYVSQTQQAAMEARTCVCAMVLEKTLSLPLAQRTFTETEVVALVTEDAARVATCLGSLHQSWSCPLRVTLLLLLLAHYVGWVAAAVAGVGSLLAVPLLCHHSHEVRQRRHQARDATAPRIAMLQRALRHIREVKATLLEGRMAHWLLKARATEAFGAEAVAMTEGIAGVLAGGMGCLLMVAALSAECVVSGKELRDLDVLVPALVIFMLLTVPLLGTPALFSVVARGFLSMKRIEAYLRQRPDLFTGTWVDLASFTAMQQQLRAENPDSTLLNYCRGSVVCRRSSFTWQHDLTEESPSTLLRDVNVCVGPGQLVVVQGSMGAGKSTLLLSILGEVNLFVLSGCSTSGSLAGYKSENPLTVVPDTEAEGLTAVYTGGAPAAVRDEDRRHPASAGAAARSMGFPTPLSNSTSLADAAALTLFVASPTGSTEARRRVGAEKSARVGATSATAVTTAKSFTAPHGTPPSGHARSTASKWSASGLAGDRSSMCSFTTASTSQLHSTDIEGGDSSTHGFLVFGSCAYCAEVPWLQNDTIRANIVASGGPVVERWYYTVLDACALSAEVTALPRGDSTVVGERGELLSLSMRCRIAIARAVYSKSHVYLMDSVLSPLEPSIQEHIIREVFHRLLRKKTVLLATNVGLRSLRPHRVFSVVNGEVREDTNLYKAVSSLHALSDEDDEEALMQRQESNCGGTAAVGDHNGMSKHDSRASQDMTLQLPTLYAEEFEEPQEAAEAETSMKAFVDNPAVVAATLLFDGDADFGSRDPLLLRELADHLDAGIPAGTLRPRCSSYLGPSLPRRFETSRSGAPLDSAMLPKEIPLPETPRTNATSGQPLMHFEGPGAALSHHAADPGTLLHGSNVDDAGSAIDCSEQGSSAGTGNDSKSTFSEGCIRSRSAKLLERERVLRHRHRLSLFIFARFMGGQAAWLLLTTLLQQGISLCADIWTAAWLAVMAADAARSEASGAKAAVTGGSLPSRVAGQLYASIAVSDLTFIGMLLALCLVATLFTLLRARAVYAGVYGTMYFIYNQVVCRVLHSPASYFDSHIIALLTRVLRDDGDVAEYRVFSTAETLLSCSAHLVVVALWNTFVNPAFMLLLPMAVSIFYQILQRHAVVLREVRRLELDSVNDMANILREVYQGAPTVRCMALQDRLREEFCRALDTINTASMVAYLVDCWVELRVHVLVTLATCTAATVGVIFTFSYSRPSFTAVAVIACLRAGPVLTMMCRSLGTFTVKEWISVQRLISLWGAPQEPLTLVGDADLYTYIHVRGNATGPLALEGADDALLKAVKSRRTSPITRQAVRCRQGESSQEAKAEPRRLCPKQQNQQRQRSQQLGSASGEGGLTELRDTAPLPAFTVESLPSSPLPTGLESPSAPVQSCTTTGPLLELRDVSARYRPTLPYVLRHVNLAVFPGERVGVIGPAGQGKRSIFNVLLRLVDVIEGDGVFVDGEDAAGIPYPILRSWFGLLPQGPLLVQGSWRSNLLLGYYFANYMLMDSFNGGADRLFPPTTTLARQPLQVGVPHVSTTPPTQLKVDAGEREPLLQRGATARTCGGTGTAAGPEDSMVRVSAVENSYGSTDNAQTSMQADHGERAVLQFMDTSDDFALTRDRCHPSADGGCRGSGRGEVFMVDTAAGQHRDSFAAFQRRFRRRNSSDYKGHISPGGAGGGGGRHRRRRGSRDMKTSEDHPHHLHGHAVEGPWQPVDDAALWEALRVVGLDAAVVCSGGLDAPLVGGNPNKAGLTDSQCRLLCLARVVLRRPPIVLLEDAVHSGAEAQTDLIIQRVLAKELRESAVLVIAHRMSTLLNLCTRAVAVQGGRLTPIANLRMSSASSATPDSPGASE